MTALKRIAHFQGRRDEAPNQALAKDLASRRDRRGIGEIAKGLLHEHAQVRSDCIKVLYEIGATQPDLVAGYAPEFFRLLASKKNREVWGAMTSIASIAGSVPN